MTWDYFEHYATRYARLFRNLVVAWNVVIIVIAGIKGTMEALLK